MPDVYFPVHSGQSSRLGTLHGVRVREDTLYTNHKGEDKKGIRKRAEKAVEKLQEILRKMLAEDEVVLYVARCQAPVSAFEQMTLGWYIYYATGAVLVFTNRRVLHFLVKSNGDWKKVLRAVSWGDVEQAKVKGWLSRTFELKYRDGKKETYWKLRGDDARKINMLIPAILAAGSVESSAAQSMVSLCPGCLAQLTPQVYQCANCRAAFKDEKTMVRRSLIIPGGGYFYIGAWFLGIGDFLVEAYLLVIVLIFLVVAAGGMTDPFVESGEAPATGGAALIAAILVGIILAVEKWLTIHHCRRFIREFIPSE